jgi:pilus assembly protein CpaB
MKSKTVILLVVAAVCGLVASYMTSRYLASQNAKVTVLVAKDKIAGYTALKQPEQLFDMEERPRNEVPKNAVVNMDAAKDQVINKGLDKGDILSSENILDKSKVGIEVSIPPGFRAVGVRTTQEAVVGGFVLPGSYVDVIHTGRGNKDEVKAQMILQKILVLAVDTMEKRPDDRSAVVSTTVSLLVTPEEATVLAAAQNTGVITFSLRSKQDDATVAIEKAKPKEPEPLPEPEKPVEVAKDPEAPKVAPITVTIINGSSMTKAQFAVDGSSVTTERFGPEPVSPPALPPAPPSAKDNEAGSK